MKNEKNKQEIRVIISGGGTGGHVFPAIAIADGIKEKNPSANILFVGAKGKIEMEKVPKAGYPVKGLWISGFHRKLTWRNLAFPFKLISSLWKSWFIVRNFRPDVVIGVGGFASGPVLEVASRMGIPTLIQEQNSYAGITNRLLAKKVDKICVAYDGMHRFFPKDKMVLTGNPVRKDLEVSEERKTEAAEFYGLDANKKTIFVFGGSLGAQSINEALAANAGLLEKHQEVQLLWQAGKLYYDRFKGSETAQLPNVEVRTFIDRMDLAYSLADLVVCRAGALTVSELCLLGKAALLIPSPNVAEDHQTQNAKALVEKDAAVLLENSKAKAEIISKALELLNNADRLEKLRQNIRKLAKPDAVEAIVEEVFKLL